MDWANRYEALVQRTIAKENYNIVRRTPEWDGTTSQRCLKSNSFEQFFLRIGDDRWKFDMGPDHPCTTKNVLVSFWSSYRRTMILLRDSAMMGREPFTPEDLGMLDEAIRCQRVWLGAIAPNDHVFKDQFHMWSHTYFFHIMWYVEKYGGVGSLTQQGIELAHKEVHKDVAIFSVAGTRVAKPADWIRIMAGYNIDLYRLSKEGTLRNGDLPHQNWCVCMYEVEPCKLCRKKMPMWLLIQ